MAQLDKIRLSGTTYDIIDSTAVHSLDGYWTTGETTAAITAATNALAESIAEQGYQTSGDVQNAISGKVDTDTYTAYTAATDTVLGGKVDNNTYTAYTAATDAVLSGKADISDIPSVSGYADAVAYDSNSKAVKFYHGGTSGTEVYNFDASPFLIDGMVQNVEIKSVEISGVATTCLVISFNTDAGKQDINIPISEIFDASNYYTKSDTDSAILAATSGKVDTDTYTAYTAATDATLASKANTANTYTLVEISDDTSSQYNSVSLRTRIGSMGDNLTTIVKAGTGLEWSGTRQLDVDTDTIQEKLTSGTNIKTINNTSILGSGNIEIEGGNKVEVSGTTLVFL